MRLGAYHFARPSGSSDAAAVASAIAQADYFLSVAEPLRPSSCRCSTSRARAASRSPGSRSGPRPGSTTSPPERASSRSSTSRPASGRTKLGDSPVAAVGGPPALDRALDEGRATDPARGELGRARLVVLAMEQLPEGSRDRRVCRRQPVQRHDPRERHRARRTPPNHRRGSVRRRSSAARRQGSCSSHRREHGVAASRSRSRIRGSGAMPPGARAHRSRERRRRRIRRTRPTSAARCPSRVSAVGRAGTVSASAAPTLAVSASGASSGGAPQPRTLPVIQGAAQAGQTLTLIGGTWTARRRRSRTSGAAARPTAPRASRSTVPAAPPTRPDAGRHRLDRHRDRDRDREGRCGVGHVRAEPGRDARPRARAGSRARPSRRQARREQ